MRPVRELVKLPVPVPSVVLLLEIVGAVEVFQHIPRAVNVEPPSLVTLPPDIAAAGVIAEMTFVVTVGATI